MELSKGRKTALMLALIMATFVPMADLFIIPAAGSMYAYFADANVSALNFILSGPALIALVVAPIAGKLMSVIRKKILLMIGVILFGIGGILGIAVENVYYMAAMRCIVGAAVGIVAPCCMAMLNDVFTDEKQLGTMMGIWNAGMSGVGAVVGIAAGIVAAAQWKAVFELFWVAVPILAVILFAAPRRTPYEESKKAGEIADTPTEKGEKAPMPWTKLILDLGGYFVGELVICVIYYEIAIYLTELSIGSAALAGTLATVMTATTFVACVSFGALFARPAVRKFLPVAMFLMIALAYFCFAFLPSVTGAVIGMALNGLANGLMMSYYQSHIAIIVPESQAPFALSLSSSVLGLAMFLTTYVFTFLHGVGPGGVTFVCLVLAIVCAVMMIPALLRHIKDTAK